MSRRRVVSLSLSLLTVATACLVGYVLWARNRPSPAPVPLTDEEVIQVWRDAGFEYGWCGKRPGGYYQFQERYDGIAAPLPAFRPLNTNSRPLPRLPDLGTPYAVVLEGRWRMVPLNDLRGLKNLRVLMLHPEDVGTPVLSDAVLKTLREVGLLHVLWLAEGPGGARPAGPEDVVSFGRFNRYSVSSEGLRELSAFTNLEELSIVSATDGDLEVLGGFKGLTSLELKDCVATDAGLENLKGLQRLHSLDIRGDIRGAAKLTEGGIKGLQKALPQCKITTR